MRIYRVIAFASVGFIFAGPLLAQQQGSTAGAHHVMLTPEEIKWAPFPSLGPRIQIAVLSGDPSKPGSPFIFLLKMPDSTRVPPHWHPVDEHITVISGIFLFGEGDKLDPSVARELPAGSYAFMPRHAHHFALAKGTTVIQLNGIGPFKTTYVNPANDPSRKGASQNQRS